MAGIETRKLIIEAGRTERHYWRDLWRYRELFYFLAWRDILVRYKQTVIGVAWALMRPFLTMVVFTVVFGKLAKLPSEAARPTPIMVFAAMLPWQFFANSLSEASNSLVGNANLISKVYFPRLIIPASSVITSFVDFLISGADPGRPDGLVPVRAGLAHRDAAALHRARLRRRLGAGLWLTALNVKYRDFRYIVPFIVQFGLYVSPVGFSSAHRPGAVAPALLPQPDGRRHRRLPLGDPRRRRRRSTCRASPALVAVVAALLLVSGVWYFRRMERSFADVI